MEIGSQLKIISKSMLDIVYPNHCLTCSLDLKAEEKHICLNCLHDLPMIPQNETTKLKLEQLFWGRSDVQGTYALLDYQKGNQVQDVLGLIKYKQKTSFAKYLGSKLGEMVSVEKGFDFIVPVPLHPKKKKLRGFNQSTIIAQGIQDRIQVPINERILKRLAHNPSQTTVSKYERWENVRDIFKVNNPTKIKGKHVLLVDDVLTTGATIEACLKQLLNVEGCQVSVATLAVRI